MRLIFNSPAQHFSETFFEQDSAVLSKHLLDIDILYVQGLIIFKFCDPTSKCRKAINVISTLLPLILPCNRHKLEPDIWWESNNIYLELTVVVGENETATESVRNFMFMALALSIGLDVIVIVISSSGDDCPPRTRVYVTLPACKKGK